MVGRRVSPVANGLAALALLATLASCTRQDPSVQTGPAEEPETIVAGTRDGKVVLLSAEDGSVQKVLAETSAQGVLLLNPNDGAPYIVLGPTADTAQLVPYPSPGQEPRLRAIGKVTSSRRRRGEAYFDIAGPPSSFEIWRVPIEGDGAEKVLLGAWPSISPDGLRIAFVSGDSERNCRRTIQVRSLDDGDERAWTLGTLRGPEQESFEEPPGVIGKLAWAEDNRTIAYEVWSLGHSHLRLLDTRSSEGELEANRLGPQPSIASWQSPNFLRNGTLGILCTFCPPDDDDPAEFWIVDGRTGRKIDSAELPATRPGEVTMTDIDASGRLLFWVTSNGTLWRRSRGSEAVRLGDGYSAADG